MKILLGTEAYWPINDGGSVFERNLVHGLRGKKHQVEVIAPSGDGKPELDQTDGYPIHRLKSLLVPNVPTYRFTYFAQHEIDRIFKEFKPDVIHVHNPYDIGRSLMKISHRSGVPIVATNHLMPENTLYNIPIPGLANWSVTESFFWNYLVKFHNRASFVTSPTATAVNLLVKHGLKAPHRPVSNGIDLTEYSAGPDTADVQKLYHLPENLPILLYTGRLDGEKRMDIWLKSLPLILKEVKMHAVIVGSGNAEASMKQLASELGVIEHVTFTGKVPHDHIQGFYRIADCFAISSPAELQSIVTLEAMATSDPVVAVDVAALPELCHDGENGFLFKENDFAGMAAGVIKILKDKALREKMGKASRAIAETHALPKMVDNYEGIYRGLIKH
jgi:glycosyltransferase involved in cell wall biosynthesis